MANTARGTFRAGQVAPYRLEPGVAGTRRSPPPSPLYKVFVDNWRQGVPFFLVSGKRLKSKLTRLVIHSKEVPHWLMGQALGEHIAANRLTLGIHTRRDDFADYPNQEPRGHRLCLRTVRMLFDYQEGYRGPRLEAYEKALLDCVLGERSAPCLAPGRPVELCWEFLDPVLTVCETCDNRAKRLKSYPAGS